jgi:hypothetical protein
MDRKSLNKNEKIMLLTENNNDKLLPKTKSKKIDNRTIKINRQKQGSLIDENIHDTNTITIVIIMFALSLSGIMFLRFLENIFIGSPNISLIRIFALCIVLNVLILVFIIISFKRIHFAQGPIGPKGNRGNKGPHGINSTLNSCSVGDSVLLSGQKKHNIKKREAAYSRYPAIVDDA